MPYHLAGTAWSPRRVLRARTAHCLEGAVFAAAALRVLGFPPLLLDLEAVQDTDHVVAVFRRRGCWGAIAKSNFAGLRYREPVYRSVRELVMSYFESFFNVNGVKSLRGYSRPVDLRRYDSLGWIGREEAADRVEELLKRRAMIPVISEEMAKGLSNADELTYRAGMLVVNQAGLYKPKH
jgi:hypothetical protein